jgi:uncharacterized protein (DUF433 family)
MSLVPQKYAHITQKQGVCGGRPTIRGTRIEVSAVAFRYRRGESVDEILEAWPHLTPGQVHDALAYYYDHQAEIDQEIERSLDEAYWMSRYPPGKRAAPSPE